MGCRPARTQYFSTTSNLTPTSIDMASQSDLAKLKKGSVVNIQHRQSSSHEFRLVKENVPAAMVNAFSGYAAANLLNASQTAGGASGLFARTSMLSITGGVFGAIKAAIDFMFAFCDDKKAMPPVQGPPLCFWMRVHEAAELLQVPILSGTARVEFLILLACPVSKDDLIPVIESFPVGHQYSNIVLDNLVEAIVNETGGWYPDSWEYIKLSWSKDGNVVQFYRVLKERVTAKVLRREQEAKASKFQAEKEEFEALQKREAHTEAARGPTYAKIAVTPCTHIADMAPLPAPKQPRAVPTKPKPVEVKQENSTAPSSGRWPAWSGPSFASVARRNTDKVDADTDGGPTQTKTIFSLR